MSRTHTKVVGAIPAFIALALIVSALSIYPSTPTLPYSAQAKAKPAKIEAEKLLSLAEAREQLAKLKPAEVKLGQLIEWLEHDPALIEQMPEWYRVAELKKFGETKRVTGESTARLASLVYLGRKKDDDLVSEITTHLSWLAKEPVYQRKLSEDAHERFWGTVGNMRSISLLIDALMRRRDLRKLHQKVKPVVASIATFVPPKGRPYYWPLHALDETLLEKHGLLERAPSPRIFQKTLRDIESQTDPKHHPMRSPPIAHGTLVGALCDAMRWSELSENGEKQSFLKKMRRRVLTLQESGKFELSMIHAASHLNVIAEEDRSINAPKCDLSLIEAKTMILDQVRNAAGIDREYYHGYSFFSVPLEYRRGVDVNVMARSAMFAALSLSGGFNSKKSLKLHRLVKDKKVSSALRVTLLSELEYSKEKIWEDFQRTQRRFFLRHTLDLLPQVRRESLLNIAPQDHRKNQFALYGLGTLANNLLGMQTLGIPTTNETYSKAYEALLVAIETLGTLRFLPRRNTTYVFSFCLLVIQQHQRYRVLNRKFPNDHVNKPISERRSGEKERQVPKKRPETTIKEMRAAMTRREKRVVYMLAGNIYTSHNPNGFGYGPLTPWKPKDKGTKSKQEREKEKKNRSAVWNPTPDYADNSNSQLAMIGLKAAVILGVELPKKTLEKEAKRIFERLVEVSSARVRVKHDASNYEKDDPKGRKTSVPIRTTPAGLPYAGVLARPVTNILEVSNTLSSGAISSLLCIRDSLKKQKKLSPELDQKIKIAVVRVKAYYAGNGEAWESKIPDTIVSAYGVFGLYRATLLDGHEKIFGKDWRNRARDYWLYRADGRSGSWPNLRCYAYQGLLTLSFNGLSLPVETLKAAEEAKAKAAAEEAKKKAGGNSGEKSKDPGPAHE